MSLHSVKSFFAQHAPDIDVIELAESTATVSLAAEAHRVAPGQIAKTLSLRVADAVVLVVTGGDTRLDNQKCKTQFGGKVKMLGAHEVEELTSHPVGGVCPFGLPSNLPVYCDLSLRKFEEVLPAAGAINACVRIHPERMATLVNAQWVDVAQSA